MSLISSVMNVHTCMFRKLVINLICSFRLSEIKCLRGIMKKRGFSFPSRIFSSVKLTRFRDHNLYVEGDMNKFQALFCVHASFTNESPDLISVCILSDSRWK